jgi:hypothetical protein
LPQQEIHKTGVSVQAPSSSTIDTLKVATVVQQIMTELSEAVSENSGVLVRQQTIPTERPPLVGEVSVRKRQHNYEYKIVLALMKQNGCYNSYAAQSHSI